MVQRKKKESLDSFLELLSCRKKKGGDKIEGGGKGGGGVHFAFFLSRGKGGTRGGKKREKFRIT